MQSIDSYATSSHLRVILQGPPGCGKTTLACQFPGAYIIDIDRNLGGSLRYLKEAKKPLPVGYDFVDLTADGKPIPPRSRYQRMNQLLLEAQSNDAVSTIVIDSATNLSDLLIEETLRLQNKNSMSDYKDGRQFWGFYAQYGKALMSILTSMRKHIVLIGHERTDTDENGNVVYPLKVNWPGQVGQIIGAFFTDVWRCEVEAKAAGAGRTYEWRIRTMPEFKYTLKNSLGLPVTFVFDWKVIEEKLK